MRIFTMLFCTLIMSSSAVAAQKPQISPRDRQFFEKKIRPIFAAHCYGCHSATAKRVRAGLRLDRHATFVKGGDSGPIVTAHSPDKSLLIKAVRYGDASLQMPPKGKLTKTEIGLLEEWVRRGAPFPVSPKVAVTKTRPDRIADGRKFWSFQPPLPKTLPQTKKKGWAQNRIDTFILAKLESRGLSASPLANPRVLMRRATFDLIGLPPTPGEIDEFLKEADANPQAGWQTAYEKLIERLLASPQYGERWARYWLDLTRYCDVAEAWHKQSGQAYHYRDWVVRAFNEDLPYDRFVQKQLAADLMPNAKPADLAALGFLGLSPKYWKELKLDHNVIKSIVAEEWEERIEAVSRTFLGLTVACARCHDHKFDPITTNDYYALAGVLASTKLVDRSLLPDEDAKHVRAARLKVQTLIKEIAKLNRSKSAQAKQRIKSLQQQIKQITLSTPQFNAPLVPAVEDAALFVMPDGPNQTKLVYKPGVARDLRLQKRGSPTNLGAITPRRFLEVLSPARPKPFGAGSGRLQLARAIVNEGAPLASRVIVNRIWKHHFGKGLVETPSDFGFQGERPSHPALLDDLAARFMDNGWSIKWLHREIMLSATYQQASGKSPPTAVGGSQADPDNRLLWRMNRRRLDVEAWRDAILSVTGNLNLKTGGPPRELSDANNNRRTIYGLVKRREISNILRLHDFPDPTAHSAKRVPTTTPLQQLFTLNSPFMRIQATALAQRLRREFPDNAEKRIRRAYRLLYGRTPTRMQIQWAIEFLTSGNRNAKVSADLWQQYVHVLLGSNEFLFVD